MGKSFLDERLDISKSLSTLESVFRKLGTEPLFFWRQETEKIGEGRRETGDRRIKKGDRRTETGGGKNILTQRRGIGGQAFLIVVIGRIKTGDRRQKRQGN